VDGKPEATPSDDGDNAEGRTAEGDGEEEEEGEEEEGEEGEEVEVDESITNHSSNSSRAVATSVENKPQLTPQELDSLLLATPKQQVHLQSESQLDLFHQALHQGDLANATAIVKAGHVALNATAAFRNKKGNDFPIATYAIMRRYMHRPKVVSPDVMFGVDADLESFLEALHRYNKVLLDPTWRTPLWEAARLKSMPLLRFLLSKGCNPATTGENGWTPMHVAVLTAGEVEVLAMRLMEAGTHHTTERQITNTTHCSALLTPTATALQVRTVSSTPVRCVGWEPLVGTPRIPPPGSPLCT